MAFSGKKSKLTANPERCKLRDAEQRYRQNKDGNFTLDDWHYKLKDAIEPLTICGVLGECEWEREKSIIWFPNTLRGKAFRSYTENQLRHAIESKMGKQRYLVDGEPENEKYMTRGEISLMLRLSQRASQGQIVNSHEELAKFRGKV